MNVRTSLYRFYVRLQKTIAPTLRYSQDLYDDVLKSHLNPNVRWLDLGCGHRLSENDKSEKYFVENSGLIVGLDYDLHSLKNHQSLDLKVRGDITKLPFGDSSFNLVTANMVVEHLDNPEMQFKEVNRILRPGGIFIFHSPNARGYSTMIARSVPEKFKAKLIYFLQERKEEDIFETHYKANTLEKIQLLAQRSGFEVLKLKMLVSDAVFQVLPPLVALELVWIRILMTRPFRTLRTNIIAVLKKETAN